MNAPALTLEVTLAVLAAGLLHASWNALLKSAPGGEPLLDTGGVVAASSLWGLAMVPFVPIPDPAAWKFMAASAAIHFAYYLTLAQAYRLGDLSFAYPLMRGAAPLLTAVLGIVFLHEWPTAQSMTGIALICGGIVSIAFVQRDRHPRGAAFWALTNACIIAMYTLVDGAGVRVAGNAASYVAWLLFLEGLPFLAWLQLRQGRAAFAYMGRGWRRALLAGFGSVAAYGIVLWAMTRAPVAAVAALRETSVLFAAVIGALLLREGFGLGRLAGAVAVVLGIAALRL